MATTAPFSSVMIGDIKVTFLPDGHGEVIPTALYPASTEEGWRKYPELLNDEGKFITTLGGFLIETADQRIVVDTGLGPVTIDFPGFGPFSGGAYLESCRRTGYSRADVTDVIFTHLHLDHVGWTTIANEAGERELLFPQARYLCAREEWEFWYGGEEPAGPHPEFVQQPLADKITFVAHGEEIAPGVTAYATPGHTPGHLSLIIASGGQRLVMTADVFHGAMQLQEPTWSVAFDADVEAARATREKLYAELTRENTLAAVNHFSGSVFGRVRPQGDGKYQWLPLENA